MSSPPPSKGPLILLGLLTLLTVAGPIAIVLAIRGGRSPIWPPDRPIEWWTFGLITGAVALLMTACLAIGLSAWRQTLAAPPPRGRDCDRGA